MATPTLKIRDWADHGKTELQAPYTDLTPYLALEGIKWSRNDIDASDAGRDQTGLMHRARVAIKIRLDCTCRPLTKTEATAVLTALLPEWLEVVYSDPQTGTDRTEVKMYSNNIPSEYKMEIGGTQYWVGITFPLIEA